ncbi:MAG: efflux RND transporter periplasmic adaptor subunit, partial [Planctomycetota bacterium]
MKTTTAVLALLIAAPAPAQEGGPPPSHVKVEAVKSERLGRRRRVTGTLRAAKRSLVAAREGGVVLELPVREGQTFEKDAVLARLDDERLKILLETVDAEKVQSEASLEELRAESARDARDLESLRSLAASDAANPKEVADAESAVRIAEARVRQGERQIAVIEARARLLRKRIADTVIRAPFAGTVVKKHTEVGQWTGEGDAVVELLSTTDLEAWLEVPQRSLGPVEKHRGTLEITVDATGAQHRIEGWRLLRQVDTRARTFFVIAALPTDASLAPGMSLTAMVPEGAEADQLTISRDAILKGETGSYVYVAAGGGEGKPASARMQPVEVLFSLGDRADVRGTGLKAGALV